MSTARKWFFILSIDTEADSQWSVEGRQKAAVTNLHALPRLHELAVRFGVKPTYLISYPVARDALTMSHLRVWVEQQQCEVGAHLHPWDSPPFADDESDQARLGSSAADIPDDRFENKMTALTETIRENLGKQPISYRSGRWGLTGNKLEALRRLGYRVDSSLRPLPMRGENSDGLRKQYGWSPYWLGDGRDEEAVLEVPVTILYSIAGMNRRLPLVARLPQTALRVLRKLTGVHELWLRPTYLDMKSLPHLMMHVEQVASFPLLHMMFHSSELMPACSPYNPTVESAEAFFAKIEHMIEYIFDRYHPTGITFSDLYNVWRENVRA